MLNVANANRNEMYKIKSMNFANNQILHRLYALGFTEGSLIKIKQKSLFNGPCTLDKDGQQICIRNCDACQIVLEHVHG
ncbi:FeoA family protein [Macrococcus armenti]|uniref:FeoA family protein n=1 Tax=Macrococcus armenti TaxID=2875764 RepID=UPI001CCDEE36|nr:FeoA family protein [Macrococcus armenti]UBH08216.1 ferrous iron transport protein A [Macrococcus armenti]UBH10447.1 ferrous iron transport protein A [Macrococcus armenti]UBH14978.1 ferrous iron transport protein A [Macrococcus armenti]UBH17337.1 ferrous iron transport protein A [Macrococcus armenti]UBH19602.1 ferrous iron transport protein A [Macrococcus armenti]